MEELLKELEEAKRKIADIEKKIEEKKTETGRWKPRKADNYWFISGDAQVTKDLWTNHFIDSMRYKIGNCYKTESEANFAIEKLKVIAELKEYEEPKSRAWDGIISHYFIYYDYNREKIAISYNDYYKGGIYFESEEKAKQAIDAIGEDRIKKYYLEVEE